MSCLWTDVRFSTDTAHHTSPEETWQFTTANKHEICALGFTGVTGDGEHINSTDGRKAMPSNSLSMNPKQSLWKEGTGERQAGLHTCPDQCPLCHNLVYQILNRDHLPINVPWLVSFQTMHHQSKLLLWLRRSGLAEVNGQHSVTCVSKYQSPKFQGRKSCDWWFLDVLLYPLQYTKLERNCWSTHLFTGEGAIIFVVPSLSPFVVIWFMPLDPEKENKNTGHLLSRSIHICWIWLPTKPSRVCEIKLYRRHLANVVRRYKNHTFVSYSHF